MLGCLKYFSLELWGWGDSSSSFLSNFLALLRKNAIICTQVLDNHVDLNENSGGYYLGRGSRAVKGIRL